jgi:hypothetical protein
MTEKIVLDDWMKEVMRTLIDDEQCFQKIVDIRCGVDLDLYNMKLEMDKLYEKKEKLQTLINFLRDGK